MSNALLSPNQPATRTPAPAGRTEAEAIADFALGLDLSTVPPAVVDLAKEHFLDVLGIALASSTWDFGRAVLQGVRELGDGAQATGIGSGAKLPPASAALVNGVLAHGLDFDDTHIGAIYHASAHAMAACLASGEANRVSGRELLTAFIAALRSVVALPWSAQANSTIVGSIRHRSVARSPAPQALAVSPARAGRRWSGLWACAAARRRASSSRTGPG